MSLKLIGVTLAATVGLVDAQDRAEPRPEFEVASIKLSRDVTQRSYGNPQPGKYVANNTPVRYIIEQAYGV